ncbi:hypothetical protein [Flavobacterium sp. I3-2]|uniref:hypothetical protein n=1 Tax=Flavobacterium sp. I3-2 TaxID=2748319 RepID=UPI0015B11791|nr:hypothetical protein [Flavobacterium sp. I3-2]
MILTEKEIQILNQIELVGQDYDALGSYMLYHKNIFESALDYIPIQYLPNHTFGFSFRVVNNKFFMQVAYSNRNRKFFKNDIITFGFKNGEELEFKLLVGSIKDFHGRYSSTIIIKPEQVKLFLLEDLEFIQIVSKRNELGYINSQIQDTLSYYSIGESFYHKTVKYLISDLLKEYLKDYPGNDYSNILEHNFSDH